MTSEPAPVPLNEDDMGSHPSRLIKPFALVAPLMVLMLVPAFVYGRRSGDVAADADRALAASFTTVPDEPGVALDPTALCDPSDAQTLTTSFAEIDLSGETHKSSVSGLGFDAVIVDLKGWVGDSSATSATDVASSVNTDQRDDITIRMERTAGDWCVATIKTLVTGTD